MTVLDEIFAPISDGRSGLRYLQLRERIESAINSGRLIQGMPLPSERELAARTGLSRVTVRKAVAPLVEQGMIVQRRGSGTFIGRARPKMEQSLSRLTSFTEDMAMRGMELTSSVISCGIGVATHEEVMGLGLHPHDSVARLSRLRIGDGRPVGIEHAVLPARVLPDPETVTGSLYERLDGLGYRPVRAVQRISAKLISAKDADILDVEAGSAGLSITRRSFAANDQVVELTSSLYRGDIQDFVAELQLSER